MQNFLYQHIKNNKETLISLYIFLIFFSYLFANTSNFTFLTSTYSLYTLKATILIFSFIIFYAIRKKIDFTFKYIFYSILSFAVISYCIKLVEFEFVVEIINLRFTIILASCFVIFFIFSKINISKNNIFFFVILLNLISLIFIYYINYDVYLRPINDNLLSGNRNTKNFFIFFTFFINSIIFCKFEKLSFKYDLGEAFIFVYRCA